MARYERRMRQGLTVLMYHRVLTQAECRGYALRSIVIPEQAFDEQIQWLAATCDVRPLREAVDRLAAGTAGERPLVAITFDDGYEDNHRAAGTLERHGLRGSFFVTTDFVEQKGPMWFDVAACLFDAVPALDLTALAEEVTGEAPLTLSGLAAWMRFLKRLPPEQRADLLAAAGATYGVRQDDPRFRAMTTADVRDLHARGHEIGSHTVTHPLLPELREAELRAELVTSRERITDWLGTPPVSLCYPNGDHDARVVAATAAAGYRFACTTEETRNLPGVHPLRVGRLDVAHDRVLDHRDRHDLIGFRSEVSTFRQAWR